MKISNVCFFLLLLCQINHSVKAEETNELYVTDDNSGIYLNQNSMGLHQEKLLEEAKKTRESLPAKDFLEGNWGESLNGIQLSLRFDKQAYTNGEQITAVLLARNTTNIYIGYADSLGGNGDGPIRLVVTTATGQPITPQQPPIIFGGHDYIIAPKTQRKHLELLNSKYNLTNGAYFIHAAVKIASNKSLDSKFDQIEWVDVKSADVQIKIEDSLPK